MYALTGDVTVDQCLGPSLGNVGGPVEGAEAQGDAQGLRAVAGDGYPGAAPADLIAGALDQHPVVGQSPSHGFPDVGHVGFVILPQHVERPDHRCAWFDGNLKTAETEVEALQMQGHAAGNAFGFNLDAEDLCEGATERTLSKNSTPIPGDAP